MDGPPKASGRGKAVLPGPASSDATNASARRPARRVLSPEDAVAAADAPEAAAAAGGGAGEEEDDEQVERFYALLDNIRAMRGAYVPGDGDGDGVETGSGGGGARKRLRAAEPPWRPAFRMEDFEEPSPTSPSSDEDAARRAAKRTQRQDDAAADEGGARPAVALSSPPPPRRAGSRLDSGGRKSI